MALQPIAHTLVGVRFFVLDLLARLDNAIVRGVPENDVPRRTTLSLKPCLVAFILIVLKSDRVWVDVGTFHTYTACGTT